MEAGANETLIEGAYEDRTRLADPEVVRAVLDTLEQLDQGKVRVATPGADGAEWTVHAWIKKAILLYFGLRKMDVMRAGDLEFFDKIPVKSNLAASGVRVVPPGIVRYGAFLEPGAIVMPGYVNIGAYVGAGTMVDTWATVGSCAQIGKDVHLAGGVGIGGVLEPPGARPVIVEDGAFIGSRVVIVEGMHVGKEAVIGAGVVLTASTTIIDVNGQRPHGDERPRARTQRRHSRHPQKAVSRR